MIKRLHASTLPSGAPARRPSHRVGIGASAGALDAITEFLTAVREHSGLAYIVVPHQDPVRRGLLAFSDGLKSREARLMPPGLDGARIAG